jgi:hypothetical protein
MDMNRILQVSGVKIVQLCWRNWSEICDLQVGLVSSENGGRNVPYNHHTCGETAGPWVELDIPEAVSAISYNDVDGIKYQEQTAVHGDYLVGLPNGKVLVIPYVDGLAISHSVDGYTETMELSSSFGFYEEDFPVKSVWKHRNGILYSIRGHSNTQKPGKPDYPPMIEYENVETGAKYSGRADDWHRRMTRVS